MTCDGCHEEWEADFFCPICSRDGELIEVTRPVVLWDYSGPDIEIVEEWASRDICFNCCPGHIQSKDRP